VDDLCRFHRVQAIPDFLDRRDQIFRLDEGGVIGDEGGVYRQVLVEVNVGMRYSLGVVQFFAHLGYASDFAHHTRNGELRDGFF